MIQCPLEFAKDVYSHLLSSNTLSPEFLVKPCQITQGFKLVSDLTYADDMVLLSNNYREMQDLKQPTTTPPLAPHHHHVLTHQTPAALIPCVLPDGENTEDVNKFKYLGFMFITNGQFAEEIRINLASSAFSRVKYVFGSVMKHRRVQFAGSAWQWCSRFCSTVAHAPYVESSAAIFQLCPLVYSLGDSPSRFLPCNTGR